MIHNTDAHNIYIKPTKLFFLSFRSSRLVGRDVNNHSIHIFHTIFIKKNPRALDDSLLFEGSENFFQIRVINVNKCLYSYARIHLYFFCNGPFQILVNGMKSSQNFTLQFVWLDIFFTMNDIQTHILLS